MSFIARLKKIGLAATLLLLTNQAIAAPPPVDTVIGNQAVATYQNAAGDTIQVESNLVETIINQIAGIDIEADQTKDGAPGGFVFFPHVLENTGNGDDTYTLAAANAAGDDIDFSALVIYPDADRDGVPDVLTPLATTPTMTAGETYGIVARATVPSAAVATNSGIFTITATSALTGTVTDVNTDTVSVTTAGIIELTKTMTPGNVTVGDTVSVTLNYTNTGLSDATSVLIQDVLPTTDLNGNAITLAYTTGSGDWSDTATAADIDDANDLVDATNGQGDTISYSYDGTDTIAATISRIPTGRTGNITFQFVVTAANAGVIQNIATSSINGGPTRNSNPANVVVDETYNVTIADRQAASYLADPDGANLTGALDSSTDDDGLDNDIISEGTNVNEGAQVPFEFVVTNHANLVDTFNLSVANNSSAGIAFPSGTTFALVHSDGITPLVDSNGDSIVDTGPIALNSAEAMRLIATLPAGSAAAAPANYSATITATSVASGNSNTVAAIITSAVLSNPVDIENIASLGGAATGGAGVGAIDDGGDPWTSRTVNPGQTATFYHRITNNGASSNSYNLEYSTTNFSAGTLPTGWTVEFYNTTGSQISNTGLIAAGASVDVEARVIVPADATPALTPGQSIYFRAISPTTGVSDTKLDAVIVNEIVDVSIQSNSSAQAAPGGIVDIPHTLTNNGNSTVTAGGISITDAFTGMAATLYYDTNNDGALDAGDPVIDNINDIGGGIAAGASARIFVRVQVPATAVAGIVEQGTVTVATALTSSNGATTDAVTANNAVVDTITIVSGDITLLKEQALDATCNGVADGAFTQGQQTADPGQCIMYRITATNTGTADATSVLITDQVPSFTTLETSCATACVVAISGNGTVNTVGGSASDENAGSTTANVGTLSPGGVAVMTFTVQIDN